MRVQVEAPRELHPIGLATFTLAAVETIQQPSFNDPTQMVERWIWRFQSDRKDEAGQPLEVAVFTGQKYGNSQARLTWLLDLMVPGITIAQAQALDTDELLGRRYEGSVKHEISTNDPNKRLATFSYLKPLLAEGEAADPFAFDDPGAVQVCAECGAEVEDERLVKSSLKRWGMILCHRDGRARAAAEKVAAGEPAAA
jgi:hypothetical protein